jgi:hypothetical protein
MRQLTRRSQGDILVSYATVSSRPLQWWGSTWRIKHTRGLPEPGDYRPGSWRDVVGLVMALVGLALIVGMMLTM